MPTQVRVALLALAVAGCANAAGEEADALRERMRAAGVFSPSRVDGGRERVVLLGQLLFFDRELSGNRNVACASCHLPADHAGDALPLGRGQGAEGSGSNRQGGPSLPRNTVSPFNRSFDRTLFWDGRVERLADGRIRAPVPLPEGIDSLLEAQALLPFLDRREMRGQPGDLDVFGAENELAALPDDAPEAIWAAVMARLMAIPEYRLRFHDAFPAVPEGEHDITHVAQAIAQFEMRLWDLTDTRLDAFLGDEHRPPIDAALSAGARRGAALFFGDAGCDRCHDGPLLSDGAYHNIGVPPYGPGMLGGVDEGRSLVTGEPRDRFAFRTPPLRNVALTGPWMHNGVFDDLEAAVRHHLHPEEALGGVAIGPDAASVEPATLEAIRAGIEPDVRPLRPLADDEVRAIVIFLHALSSQTELGVFPGIGVPHRVPSELPFAP